jgi:galactokinase
MDMLQNVYSATFPREQPVAVGLALSDRILAGRGACRVHAAASPEPSRPYVPHDLVDTYLATMSAVFGQEACSLMQIRQIGSTELQVD